RRQLARVHDANGYRSDSTVGPVARAIIRSFAETVRADGRLPIVILFHEKGFDDHLYALLAPTLREHNIPFLSTHELAPASDHDSFMPDGHFTAEVDERIARLALTAARRARRTGVATLRSVGRIRQPISCSPGLRYPPGRV
ncbi:MAG: hypothetical protein IH801_04045, partial [Nitrospinae bacterium]|nr:hypothetical protein [Nitrospinota bacterium]